MIILTCFSVFVVTFASASEYAYVPFCPGVTQPVTITESAIEKFMFVVLQVHVQPAPNQYAEMHRRRCSVKSAANEIGTDPLVDFKRRKTAVFMDGYLDSANYPTARILVGNFAYMGYNTISPDAQALYSQSYPRAVRATYLVGNITATLLKDLMQYGLKPKDIELVGVSLGAQSVSLVAKSFYKLTGKKVGRIFSMDPSGPCYRGLSPEYRLTPSDADMVQVVHTGSDGFGMGDAQGHVDFYVNGGEWQHALNPDQPWCEDFCSHFMSFVYLYTSLRIFPDEFVGIKCKNVQQAREHRCYENVPYETNVMGFKADPKKPGIYYVPVLADFPIHAPKDFMETKTVYPVLYDDAMSDVEHFVLSARSVDNNWSPNEDSLVQKLVL